VERKIYISGGRLMWLVEDDEIEIRAREFMNTSPTLISPEYRIQLMILCVLGDIRTLLQVNKPPKEDTNGYRDELEHQG
jgi:hypothetical protein